MAILRNTNISETSGILTLPTGTTAQRPASPDEGMMRFNTDLGYVEIFLYNSWQDVREGRGNTVLYVPLYGPAAGDITDQVGGVLGTIGGTNTRNYSQGGSVGLYLNGGGYLDIINPNVQLLSGNPFWTIEWWAWNFGNSPTGSASTMLEMTHYLDGILYRGQGSSIDHYWRGAAIGWGNVTTGSWCHYAIVGRGTDIRVFNNGTAVATPAVDARFAAPLPANARLNPIRLGASNHTTPTGQYSNAVWRKFKVSRIARYWNNFTATTEYPL